MILGVHVTRQLWIQLRLLGLLTLPALASIAGVIVEGQSGPAAGRLTLAVGFAVAAVLSAVLVGTGFAEEIRSGAAGWLVVRAVPRTALIGAWLVVPVVATLLAYVLAGILAGLAIPPASQVPDPLTIAVSVLAAAAPAIPLSAAALAIGVDAPGRVTALAVVIAGALLAVPLVMLGQAVVHPASGYWLVAGLTPGDRPITVGLEAIGLCLAMAALLWFLASRRFIRRDL
ncbi:MAG TPA: hypothetical protein VIA02_02130 [Candidatus Limnocylindria bacterium]|jgi:hypothetical protein